ncbi:HAD family hydrolase [Actinomarinicola tropica]|uniref:HAD-IA family hydrolase n=1 Tax=Actinomarinicola tropica TaxID=2789776 RepID=A0A5Q2RMX5_9ACTN|nr:HAD family hydrolase [Actinomarinicola tropica]QGG95756.1 HAD-IA family hydrolase [Actinomarinicola tropica]
MPPDSLPSVIAGVSLDAGGVLALPSVAEPLERRGVAATPATVLHAHHAAVAVEDARFRGRTDVTDGLGDERLAYYRAFGHALGIDGDDADALAAELDEIARSGTPWRIVAPGATEVVGALDALGVRVVVVSNSDGTVHRHLAEMGICQVGPGPAGEVAAIVDSHVVGVRKPDPAIFDHAVAALGCERSATVHVGDTVAFDVASARAAGLGSVHYDATGRCTDDDHAHVRSLDELVALVAAHRPAPSA